VFDDDKSRRNRSQPLNTVEPVRWRHALTFDPAPRSENLMETDGYATEKIGNAA